MKNHLKNLLFLTLMVLNTKPAKSLASQAPDLKSPEVLALARGGKGAYHQEGASQHQVNPASFIHFASKTKTSVFYAQNASQSWWGMAAYENNKLPVALSFIKNRASSDNILHLSLASFLSKALSMGASVIRFKTNKATHWNASLGVLFAPSHSPLSMGAAYTYFMPLTGGPFQKERQGAIGLEYRLKKNIHLRGDLLYNPHTRWAVALGAKALFSKILLLHLAGFKSKNVFFYSAGLGLKGKNTHIHYTFQQNEKQKNTTHGISLSFYL